MVTVQKPRNRYCKIRRKVDEQKKNQSAGTKNDYSVYCACHSCSFIFCPTVMAASSIHKSECKSHNNDAEAV